MVKNYLILIFTLFLYDLSIMKGNNYIKNSKITYSLIALSIFEGLGISSCGDNTNSSNQNVSDTTAKIRN